MPIRFEGTDKDIEALKADVEAEVKKIALTWYQAIITGTPVDTGFHRNNWQLDFGAVNPRVDGSPASPPQGTEPAAARFLEGWTIEAGSIFIHNSGPAIEYLDEGSSTQAPQGIIDPATAAVRGRFR